MGIVIYLIASIIAIFGVGFLALESAKRENELLSKMTEEERQEYHTRASQLLPMPYPYY